MKQRLAGPWRGRAVCSRGVVGNQEATSWRYRFLRRRLLWLRRPVGRPGCWPDRSWDETRETVVEVPAVTPQAVSNGLWTSGRRQLRAEKGRMVAIRFVNKPKWFNTGQLNTDSRDLEPRAVKKEESGFEVQPRLNPSSASSMTTSKSLPFPEPQFLYLGNGNIHWYHLVGFSRKGLTLLLNQLWLSFHQTEERCHCFDFWRNQTDVTVTSVTYFVVKKTQGCVSGFESDVKKKRKDRGEEQVPGTMYEWEGFREVPYDSTSGRTPHIRWWTWSPCHWTPRGCPRTESPSDQNYVCLQPEDTLRMSAAT